MNCVSPESVGFSSKRLNRVNERMHSYIDNGKLAGALTMLARRDEVFHFETYGVQDLESGVPVSSDTIFRLYSMTKPITSVAAMMLYEEGHFSLDDPVGKFIPDFANMQVFDGMGETGMGETGMRLVAQDSPITIRHLLTHTSGLSYGLHRDTPIDAMYHEARIADADSTLKDVTGRLGEIPLVNQPGTRWRYSMSSTVLGYLVEVVSGKPFDRFLRERIFTPLGMEDTSFFVPEGNLDRLATAYVPSRGGGIAPHEGSVTTRHKRPHAMQSGGAGLVSTAPDYMRFCQMLLNGGVLDGERLLAPKTVQMMVTDHLTDDLKPYIVEDRMAAYTKGCGFGLGFSVVNDIAQHGIPGSNGMYSWFGAASCYFWIDPTEELIAILKSQFLPVTWYPLHREFQTATYQAMIE
ncbi:MAG: serine hydrolase [Chloroflexota bacterium]|nr:serine hydrolase [Chloroflexota bacterium]